MALENTAVAATTAAAPAAAAPAATTAATPADAAAAAAAATAAAATATANATKLATAETAFAQAISAAQGKPADSVEAKAAATARDALKALHAPAPVKKAPENYEDFKAPTGVSLDKSVVAEVKAVAKALDLSQADAQTLIDKVGPVLAKSDAARMTTFVTKRADDWRAASLADSELGGTPEKFEENRAVAMKTFDAFGGPALRDVLNKTGLGDNPEVLRWAFRIGKLIGPDNKFVAGATVPQAKSGALEDRAVSKLWPDKP